MPPLRLFLIALCCSAATTTAGATSLRTSTRSLLTKSEKQEKRLRRREERRERREKRAERIAARLEKIKDIPKNICPTDKPVERSSCRRHWRLPSCEYEFMNVPILLDDGSCSESIGCVSYSQCSCSRRKRGPDGKVWECSDKPFATCQGADTYDSSKACIPETDSPTSTPTLSPVENVFQRDERCPLQMPQAGAACQRSPVLLPCGYDYYNSPTYEEDGTCVAPLQCLPQAGCNCFDGEWDCYTETRQRCNGPSPPGSLTSCTP